VQDSVEVFADGVEILGQPGVILDIVGGLKVETYIRSE
jgi:hypothetical protein